MVAGVSVLALELELAEVVLLVDDADELLLPHALSVNTDRAMTRLAARKWRTDLLRSEDNELKYNDIYIPLGCFIYCFINLLALTRPDRFSMALPIAQIN
jgi:hypothetical protein